MPKRSKVKEPTFRGGKNCFLDQLDPLHRAIPKQELVDDIWQDKYRWLDESLDQTFQRVAHAINGRDGVEHVQEVYEAMVAGLWMPGGRIIAGAGTNKRVTLMNCYVNKKLEDSLDDIMHGVSIAALTQQQGGGIGTDFSTLRPQGAVLHRTGAKASGPLPFMDMWHAMCSTIMSAGARRGAMMGTLCDTHPDLPQFITAKQKEGRLTNFNVSVLVSDAFMEAVREDEDWVLSFPAGPAFERSTELADYDDCDEDGVTHYAYSVHKARDLWANIIRNTYDWSEPGIIFIDRINSLNNLKYCEHIHCTNPCGEQPLPPNGTCNLGAINLARLVKNPFKSTASINWDLLALLAKIGMRFLDNVIEATQYPLKEQADEEFSKRRTGLGVSGLADCLAQLSLRYGSAQSVAVTEKIFQTICLAVYEQSMDLAIEKGPFPNFNPEHYLDSTFAGNVLSEEYHERIKGTGIRNGVLLTVAPTGTTSILYGNISSGIEPVFAHKASRKVRQADNTFKEYTAYGYNLLLYSAFLGKGPEAVEPPPFMVEAKDLSIEDHVATQAAVQRWVDASVSKTINVPEKTTFEAFSKVYDLAYTLGCKGCTTYRPSAVRGSILSRVDELPAKEIGTLPLRPETLQGVTHKLRWPSMSSALYLTVNWTDKKQPFEIFFSSKDARSQEWMTALSLMVSAILRRGGDTSFIGSELQAVHSLHDTAWIKVDGTEKPKFFTSLLAYIGYVLSKDLTAFWDAGGPQTLPSSTTSKERCPACTAPAMEYAEGCKTCSNCGFSTCQ